MPGMEDVLGSYSATLTFDSCLRSGAVTFNSLVSPKLN